MRYADTLLADGEIVARRSRQHWLALLAKARWALLSWLVTIGALIIIAVFKLEGIARDVLGWIALASLVVGIVLFFVHAWRWWAQDYIVTNRRIMKVEGVFNKHAADSSLEKINDAVLSQGILARMLGYGDLDILTAADTAIDRYRMLAGAAAFKIEMLNRKHALDLEIGGSMPTPPVRLDPSGSSATAAGRVRGEEGRTAGTALVGFLEDRLVPLIAAIIILLVGFPIHEFSHAWTADRLGDSTARYMGRISLDPRRHFDPMGGILLLLSSVGFGIPLGWAKPTPINPANLRRGHRGEALVALAGPLSNLIMAAVVSISIRIIGASPDLQATISGNELLSATFSVVVFFVWINVILAFFNLIPISPLDGWAVLKGFLSPLQAYQYRYQLAQVERYGPMILIGLLAIGLIDPRIGPLQVVLGRVAAAAFSLLTGLGSPLG